MLIEHDPTTSRVNHAGVASGIDVAHFDGRVEVQTAFLMCDANLLWGVTDHALSLHHMFLGRLALLGDVVKAQHHVLRRNGNRCPIGRVEDVVGTEHQKLGFQNGC